MCPIVSIIIPTAKRPKYLVRAINSCIVGTFASQTEVLVIPNGPDTSWHTVRELYAEDARVRFHYVPQPDQNIARNFGLSLASGILIRFLDDDDFLLPDAAARQYEMMLQGEYDICSGNIRLEDKEGQWFGDLKQPNEENFTKAAISHKRLQMVMSHVYRRVSLDGCYWPVGIRQSEDIVWLIRFALKKQQSWRCIDECVAVWYQHDSPRMSLDRPSGFVHVHTVRVLLEAQESLKKDGRWSSDIANITAVALWNCIHRAFMFSPIFWTKIALLAKNIEPTAVPDIPIYKRFPARQAGPILYQWMVLPKRYFGWALKATLSFLRGRDYRRTL